MWASPRGRRRRGAVPQGTRTRRPRPPRDGADRRADARAHRRRRVRRRRGPRMNTGAWMRGNLTTQGYCLPDSERRALWLGLRFSTGACLALVVAGLALQSAGFCALLGGMGVIAGAPSLPPNPRRRRDAFKIGTTWLAVVAVLFAAGANSAALVMGVLLVAACATVTVTNLGLPSEALSRLERQRHREEVRSA